MSGYLDYEIFFGSSLNSFDVANTLTKSSFWCRVEHMYEMERFSISRHGSAGAGKVSELLDSRPVQLQAGWEKHPGGTPR